MPNGSVPDSDLKWNPVWCALIRIHLNTDTRQNTTCELLLMHFKWTRTKAEFSFVELILNESAFVGQVTESVRNPLILGLK